MCKKMFLITLVGTTEHLDERSTEMKRTEQKSQLKALLKCY